MVLGLSITKAAGVGLVGLLRGGDGAQAARCWQVQVQCMPVVRNVQEGVGGVKDGASGDGGRQWGVANLLGGYKGRLAWLGGERGGHARVAASYGKATKCDSGPHTCMCRWWVG